MGTSLWIHDDWCCAQTDARLRKWGGREAGRELKGGVVGRGWGRFGAVHPELSIQGCPSRAVHQRAGPTRHSVSI